MELSADRCLIDERGAAIDLETGERICLAVSTAGGGGEQVAWAERCARFASVVHPACSPLVDDGTRGATQQFEAWGAQSGWRGTPPAARHARERASRFLMENQRTPAAATSQVVSCEGRAVVVPDARAGLRGEASAWPRGRGACGAVRRGAHRAR